MTLRLSDEENRHLDELAAVEGRSKQEVVRSALAERWQRHHRERQLAEAMSRATPRYGSLLDRFGTV